MKLFHQYKKPDPVKTQEALSAGYRVKHPERISGYGRFLFSPGDVYISDSLDYWVARDANLRPFLMNCLARFNNEDYGDISQDDIQENGENLWLGNGSYMFARYPYKKNMIKIRTLPRFTYICYDSEFDPSPDQKLEHDQIPRVVD